MNLELSVSPSHCSWWNFLPQFGPNLRRGKTWTWCWT